MFNEHIPSEYLTPNEHTTNSIINSPPKDLFKVSSSKLTEDRHLIKRGGNHMFLLNSHSKVCHIDCDFPY